jgi:hypothetical protein
MSDDRSRQETLAMLLRMLKLPSFVAAYEEVATKAERHGWTFGQYLHHLCEQEVADRQLRRIERLQRKSQLPSEKTLATLNRKRLPQKVARQLPRLCAGDFLAKAENVLAFGLPGRGKTHLLCAIGHELIQHGYTVLFTPTYRLVQRLLIAKRDLTLERELQKLDRFEKVWPRVRAWLDAEPDRTAKDLLEQLQTEYPREYPDHLLRTLQRRAKAWRAEASRRLMFPDHDPEGAISPGSPGSITQ